MPPSTLHGRSRTIAFIAAIACRSDVIGSLQKQPQPGGVYYGRDGYWSWWSAAPSAARQPTTPVAARATVFAGAAAVVVLAVVGAVVIARRRRGTVDERE